jgi:flagellar basal body-associated protein FliL
MAIHGNDGHGGPQGDGPAKSAKIVWLVGLVLLALVVVIAIRAFVAGADVPTAQDAAKAPITETDQAIAGTKVENSSGH